MVTKGEKEQGRYKLEEYEMHTTIHEINNNYIYIKVNKYLILKYYIIKNYT